MGKSDRRSQQNVRTRQMARTSENRGFCGDPAPTSDIALSEIKSAAGYRLSEKELALIGEDADGRLDPLRAARLLAQSAIRTEDQPEWSSRLVKARLREAARGIERLGGRVGPASKLTFWIDYRLFKHISDFDRNAQAEGLSEGTRAPTAAALNSGGMSDVAISRIEQAILWPLRYLSDDGSADERLAVHCWMGCEARRENFSERYVELGCSWATARRRRDAGFDIISTGLSSDDVLP